MVRGQGRKFGDILKALNKSNGEDRWIVIGAECWIVPMVEFYRYSNRLAPDVPHIAYVSNLLPACRYNVKGCDWRLSRFDIFRTLDDAWHAIKEYHESEQSRILDITNLRIELAQEHIDILRASTKIQDRNQET
jgi:hypothetical protein